MQWQKVLSFNEAALDHILIMLRFQQTKKFKYRDVKVKKCWLSPKSAEPSSTGNRKVLGSIPNTICFYKQNYKRRT